MRRIVIWLASTVTIVVLLFGYHTSTNRTEATATAPSSASGGASASGGSSSGSGSTSGAGPAGGAGGSGTEEPSASPTPSSGSADSGTSGSGSSAAKTYAGSVAQTRWGPVQVEITVADRKITKVNVVQYPDGNHHDEEINSYAIPTLVQETLSAQSAKIDMVSGATVTSDGYVESLQSALDKAGI